MNGYLSVFLTAMTPVLELRGSIPVGLFVYQLNPIYVFLISVLGNIIPPIFILIFLDKFSEKITNSNNVVGRCFRKYFAYLKQKNKKRFVKFGEYLALISFVAIPLPITGAWTGSICAFLFGIKPRKSYPLIVLGVIIAGLILTITLTGFAKLL